MARVLVVGPHPDDQELGMGGTIAKLASQGHDVLLLDVTNGEPTPIGDAETRAKEAAAAIEILQPENGPGRVRRVLLGLPNRYVEHSIEARHRVAGVIRAHQAEIVFTPYPEDAHPDHRAVTRIVEDARFDAKLTKVLIPPPVDAWTDTPMVSPGDELGPPIYPKWLFYYYCTHLRHVPTPSFLVDVSGFGARKMDAIRAYETQFVLPEKNRRVVSWVEDALGYFGSRLGVEQAEAFYTNEPIGLSGFDSLSL